jgi:sugar phosphate isomerase/epimerase
MRAITRKQFLKAFGGAGAAAVLAPLAFAGPALEQKIKLGVSLYSYTGDYPVTTNLKAFIADVACIGAEGIEIVPDIHIPNYPTPSSTWIGQWHELMSDYKTQPSCYKCRMVSSVGKRDMLTQQEFLNSLVQDMQLAKRLGFNILQPAWESVIPAQGSVAAWRQMAQRILPYAEKHGVKVAFDVNAAGPAVDSFADFIARTQTKHLGIVLNIGKSGMQPGGASFRQLQAVLPYTLHVRAQFVGSYLFHTETTSWRIAEEPQRYTAPIENMIPLLLQAKYEGVISSEYEGPRIELVASNHLQMQNARMLRLIQRA